MTPKDEALRQALAALHVRISGAGRATEAEYKAAMACRAALAQKDEQEPVGEAVPREALSLSGDAKLAHDQCRVVVHLANSFSEIYAARAAIVAHDARLADQIGEASASAMEWLGDELNAMDAATEDDGWLDQIFEAAQKRWPHPPKRKPLTDEFIKDEWERVTGHSIFGGDKTEGRTMYIAPEEVHEFDRAIEAKLLGEQK